MEHAAGLAGHGVDFQKLFLEQEVDDEDSASLADVLDVLVAVCPGDFLAKDVAELVNNNRGFGALAFDDEESSQQEAGARFFASGRAERSSDQRRSPSGGCCSSTSTTPL